MSRNEESRNQRIYRMTQDPNVDMSIREIAEMYGITVSTVRDIVYRFRRQEKEVRDAPVACPDLKVSDEEDCGQE